MTHSPSLRALWAMLREQPAVLDKIRLLPIDDCDGVWASLDEAGNPGVLIAVPVGTPSGTLRAVGLNTFGLMNARSYPTMVHGERTQALLVSCTAPDVLDAFTGFVEHFVRQLSPGCDAGQLLLACVEEFRRLLLDADVSVPNPVVGLLGELVTLERLTARWADAWRTWGRPRNERHDFRNDSAALEVKSSLRASAAEPIVHIGAIDQLEPPPGGRLFLVWFRFEHDPAGAVSLPGLVEAMNRRLSSDGRTSLMSAVRAVVGAAALPDRRFSVAQELVFQVDESFPAVVPSRFLRGSVDPGVTRISNEINLSVVQARALPFDVSAKALQGEKV